MLNMNTSRSEKQGTNPAKVKALAVARGLTIRAPHGDYLVVDSNFALTNQSRIALVGANGSGKSTILKALMDVDSVAVTSGSIEFPHKGQRVEYVPQYPPAEILEMPLEDMVVDYIAKRSGDHGETWRAYAVLSELGFSDQKLSVKMKNLSGGEINMALLARALATEPTLILLDEPTNHLDTEGIYRFESALKTLKVPFLIVSHDRELLDRFTNETLFLAYKKIQKVDLPYSEAKLELAKQREALIELRAQQERRRQQIVKRVQWLQAFARISDDMAPVYRAHLTKLARFESQMVEVPQEKKSRLRMESVDIRAQTTMRIKDYSVKIPGTDQTLYSINNLFVTPGERLAIMGPNGAGKSTLLEQIVAAYQPTEAKSAEDGIRLNPQVQLGYYDQKQRALNPQTSLIDFVSRSCALSTEAGHRALAGAGFPYARHNDIIGRLSGGERARLQFLAIKERGVNFLILDEPTNHLDVEGIEQLETNLQTFSGTVMFVSHDRRFLDNVCSHILDVDFQTIMRYSGNYAAFEIQKALFLEQKEKEIVAQEKEIERKQAFVDRFRYKASKARQAQSRLKQLEKMEVIEPVKISRKTPIFQFNE